MVIVCFLAGLITRRIVGRLDSPIAMMDRYVLGVALPSLVVSKMSRASFDAVALVPVAVAWGCISVTASVALVIGRATKMDDESIGAVLMMGALGNTSFLGLGVVQGLLGTSALASAITFDQLGTFLGLATYGTFVAARFGRGAGGWRDAIRRMARFGPFLALVASPAVGAFGPPVWMYSVLAIPAFTVAPVAMFSLGWRFESGHVRGRSRLVAGCLAWKMVIVPAGVLCIAIALGTRGEIAWRSAILQSATPPMVTAGVVAASAGLDAPLVSAVLAVGTLAAGVTLPLWWLAVR